MRILFSPEGSRDVKGDLVQDFFKPSRIVVQVEGERRWGGEEESALLEGLRELGVGRWGEMISAYPALARYDETAIRVKAARALGTQSLARHSGWRGDARAVAAERTRHREIGVRLGLWKGGVLVDDGSGRVTAALAEGAAAAEGPEGGVTAATSAAATTAAGAGGGEAAREGAGAPGGAHVAVGEGGLG